MNSIVRRLFDLAEMSIYVRQYGFIEANLEFRKN